MAKKRRSSRNSVVHQKPFVAFRTKKDRKLTFPALYVPWGNRTLNWPLGGACYIHLTKGTPVLVIVGEVDIALQPDIAFEAPADLRLTQQIYYIDTNVKCQFITANC